MELYIIRHAIAHQLGKKNSFTDKKRALTADGRDRMREIAKGLRKLGVELDLIMTSPMERAVETAEIVAAALKLDKKNIVQTDNLKPNASSTGLISELKKRSGIEAIAIVGHQPDLGKLVAKIVKSRGDFSIQFKKGSVCCIEVTETVPTLRGSLMWLLTPKQLRLLAKS